MGPSGTRQENLGRMSALLREAAGRGAHIACFPELSLTPYFPRARELPNAMSFFDSPDSLWLEALRQLAGDLRINIIVPYAEVEENKRYNSAVIFDRRGKPAGRYRKVHIPRGLPNSTGMVQNYEDHYFQPGNLGFPVFQLDVARIGLQICYDRQFPEGFRALGLGGADIVFLPTNSPTYGRERRRRLWNSLLQVRAFENGYFLVAAGKAGIEEEMEFIGSSAVVSPMGDFLSTASTDGDEVVLASLDLAELDRARLDLPVRLVRCPDKYGILVDDGGG
jgi:predicted amidohydrolase